MRELRSITLMVAFALLTPWATDAQAAQYKDPDLARTYSLYFSGAGQIYTGEYLRGGLLLGASVFSLRKLFDELACSLGSRWTGDGNRCSQVRKFLWLGGMILPYIYGIRDSRASAERVNAKLRSQPPRVSALLDADSRGRLMLGFSTTF